MRGRLVAEPVDVQFTGSAVVTWRTAARAILLTHAAVEALLFAHRDAGGRHEGIIPVHDPFGGEACHCDYIVPERKLVSRLATYYGRGVPAERLV